MSKYQVEDEGMSLLEKFRRKSQMIGLHLVGNVEQLKAVMENTQNMGLEIKEHWAQIQGKCF